MARLVDSGRYEIWQTEYTKRTVIYFHSCLEERADGMAEDYYFKLPSAGLLRRSDGTGSCVIGSEVGKQLELDMSNEDDLYRTRFDSA